MNLDTASPKDPSAFFDSFERHSVYRLLFIIGALGFIFLGCLIVLKPFFPALLLAAIFCLSTWPGFSWLKHKLGGHTILAASLMTLLLALCFLIPLVFVGSSLAENFSSFFQTVMETMNRGLQHPPAWLREIPWIGDTLNKFLRAYPEGNQQQLITPVTDMLIKVGTSIGQGIVDLSIGVLISFFFFCHGAQAARHLRNLIDRFAGERGRHLLFVSKNITISVVYGILGTALAQGGVAALGFWIARIPGAPFLGLMTFFLSLIPVGPPLIWVPASLWLFSQGETSTGLFMALWGLLGISAIDNVIRPYFISLGSNLPLLLVLLGVLGGIITFGFIGLFIGPTLLAVAYTIIMEWSTGTKPDPLPEESLAEKNL